MKMTLSHLQAVYIIMFTSLVTFNTHRVTTKSSCQTIGRLLKNIAV